MEEILGPVSAKSPDPRSIRSHKLRNHGAQSGSYRQGIAENVQDMVKRDAHTLWQGIL